MSDPRPSCRFPRSARILARPEYLRVQQGGSRFYAGPFVFAHLPDPQGAGRLGITVAKKVVRRANRRNRIKRLTREVYRLHRDELPRPLLLVLILRRDQPVWNLAVVLDAWKRFVAKGFAAPGGPPAGPAAPVRE